jgi:hypothetical protein
MAEDYKKEHRSLHSVAVMLRQTEVRAPDHESFTDADGHPRVVKCPECEKSYAIGYPRLFGPDETFEVLSERLLDILSSEHRANKKPSHPEAIPLH